LNKKIVMGCSIIGFLGVVIVAGAIWYLYSFYSGIQSMRPEMPVELREARVVLGSELFQKDKFTELEKSSQKSKGIGSFEDIAIGNLDGNPGTDIVVAGRYGAAFFDLEGRKQSQILYAFEKTGIGKLLDETTPSIGDMQIIDIENDGKCEYLGDGGTDGAAVFDHQGKQLWSYGEYTEQKASIKNMAAGDIDGDGTKEFAALYNGIDMFDNAGKLLWSREEKGAYYQIEIVDTESDGKPEIFHSRYGEGYISDGKGELLRKIEIPFYLSQFAVCQLPDKNGSGILAVENGFLWIIDFEGKSRYKFEAPLSYFLNPTRKDTFGDSEKVSIYKVKALWGKFLKDQPECLAVVTRFGFFNTSVFYIYNKSGQLLYQEVLPEECHGVALLPQTTGGSTQGLLVAGSKTVWRYVAK
jgi:hypothetical protein